MALIRAISGSGGSGSGKCAMIHIDRASNTVRVFASSQTESKAVNQSMGSGSFTINVDGLGAIVVDTTNTNYGCAVTVTPTSNFNYMEYTTQGIGSETIASSSGTLTSGVGTTFNAYYYQMSASRPWQIELLLWE